MMHTREFFKRIFPVKKQLIAYGLSYAAGLIAIKWYPVPMLLEKLPLTAREGSMAIALLFVFLVVWIFLTGKLFAKEAAILGWTAIGGVLISTLLVLLSRGKFVESLISAAAALILYVIASGISYLRSADR